MRLAVAVMSLALAAPAAAQEQIGIAHGATPPAVSIEDLDGAPVDLGQWIGARPLVIEFWATWCSNCAEMEPRLVELHRRYGDRVQFLAVAVAVNQRQRTIKRHLADHPLPFPVLWDTRGRAARAFVAQTTSYIVILDRTGRVVYTGSGGHQDLSAALAGIVN